MKRFGKIMLGIMLVCLVVSGFLFVNNDIGVAESKLESYIRASQKIMDDWTVDGSVSDTMAAFISYPQDKNDHTYSVYVNRSGFSFGYFFRGGGDIVEVEKYIAEYIVEGYSERAFISMNKQNVVRLEIDNGNEIDKINIDKDTPFAIVLPVNAGSVTFSDENGDVVEKHRQAL